MTDRPNILLITTDQQRADHLGCYGNPVVRTPAIDGLAARGTIFERFYVACPICMPNRIAMMTGRMPTVNGSRHNGIPLALDAVTYVDLLQAGGYRTGLVGKCHLQNLSALPLENPDFLPRNVQGDAPPEALSDATRERRVGPEYEVEQRQLWQQSPNRNEPKSPYYGFDHVRFANGHADSPQGHYTAWLNERSGDGDALRGRQNALPDDTIVAPQTWRSAVPEELWPTTYIAEESAAFIADHVAASPDAPFFLHCSFTDPHHPFAPPGRYFDMYDPDDMELPPSFHIRGPDEPEFVTKLREDYASGVSRPNGPFPFCTGEAETRQMIALTYGMITMVDDAIGRLLAQIDALGLTENTIVVFTSDHGDFMGDHGLMLKHGLHYEGAIRVPFIWCDPSFDGPDCTDLHGSSLDLGAMILASANLAPYNGFQGLPLADILDGTVENPRRGIVIEEDELGAHLGQDTGLRTRSYIEDNWRLTLWHGQENGELFDRNTDPHEISNLFNDASAATRKSQMMEGMLREMIRLNDTAPLAACLV